MTGQMFESLIIFSSLALLSPHVMEGLSPLALRYNPPFEPLKAELDLSYKTNCNGVAMTCISPSMTKTFDV